MDKLAEVCEAAERIVVPSTALRRTVERKAEEIMEAVREECSRARLDAEVQLNGSVAKDTWLPGHVDVDVFIRLPPTISKPELGPICLPIAKRALKPNPIIERYSDHPYAESLVQFRGGEFRVNIVPCYRIERGYWLSATDRTPYHTLYVKEHLKDLEQRNQVRLLKAFLRCIGAYGAEIKTGGFSGMLSETLIIAFGDFQKTLQAFKDWRKEGIVDPERYYESNAPEIHRLFPEPLVVIDPVDKGRNLAAAVRSEQLWNFTAASRHFLLHPHVSYFKERRVNALTSREYLSKIHGRGTVILCLVTGRIGAVVDVLWSQLYKTERALKNLLENNDFKVLRSASWTDEKETNIILFELEGARLAESKEHIGPPVTRARESSAFLAKHHRKDSTIAGPWIKGERWRVQKKRPITSARILLKETVARNGRRVGVARLLVESFKKKLGIYENEEITKIIAGNREFSKFLRTYLDGRPPWLA